MKPATQTISDNPNGVATACRHNTFAASQTVSAMSQSCQAALRLDTGAPGTAPARSKFFILHSIARPTFGFFISSENPNENAKIKEIKGNKGMFFLGSEFRFRISFGFRISAFGFATFNQPVVQESDEGGRAAPKLRA